jgi:hypothetical protein
MGGFGSGRPRGRDKVEACRSIEANGCIARLPARTSLRRQPSHAGVRESSEGSAGTEAQGVRPPPPSSQASALTARRAGDHRETPRTRGPSSTRAQTGWRRRQHQNEGRREWRGN